MNSCSILRCRRRRLGNSFTRVLASYSARGSWRFSGNGHDSSTNPSFYSLPPMLRQPFINLHPAHCLSVFSYAPPCISYRFLSAYHVSVLALNTCIYTFLDFHLHRLLIPAVWVRTSSFLDLLFTFISPSWHCMLVVTNISYFLMCMLVVCTSAHSNFDTRAVGPLSERRCLNIDLTRDYVELLTPKRFPVGFTILRRLRLLRDY